MPTSDKILLPFVRLSYPKLTKAVTFEEGQDPRYEATFLLDPKVKGHARIIKLIKSTSDKLCKEEWGRVPKDLKPCFGDDGHGKEYDGYDGMFVVATNKKEIDGRPLIVDVDGNPLHPGDEGFPYAGCYVHAGISLWTNDHPKGGKRVLGNLRSIQFAKDGAAFSNRAPVDADKEFDGVDEFDVDDFNFEEGDPLDDDFDDDDLL